MNEWILEPVNKDLLLGSIYATNNYNKYVLAYPKLTQFEGTGTRIVQTMHHSV